MPIILAIEPDRRQASRLASVVRQRVGAELILAETTEGALDAIGNQIPDLVLVPTLLSPQDDAALAAALRVIATAAHVHTLTIPVLAADSRHMSREGRSSWWRRGRGDSQTPDGCDPAVFAEQITAYLREAAAERESLESANALKSADRSSFERAESPVAARLLDMHVAAEADTRVVAEFATVAEFANEVAADSTVAANVAVAAEAVTEVPLEFPTDVATTNESAVEMDLVTDVPLEAAIDVATTNETAVETDVVSDVEADVVLEAAAEDMTGIDAAEETAEDMTGADAAEETYDDEIEIDLSDDLAETSEVDADEELFAGEPVGVYEIPSVAIDDPLVTEFQAPIRRPFAASAPFIAQPRAEATDRVDEPVASELEQAIIDEFSAEAFVPEEFVSDRFDAEAWISMDLRFGRSWPPLQGMLADASSPRDTATREEAPVVAAIREETQAPVAAAIREETQAPVAAAPPRRNERAEWSELVASLRQDLERRRGEPAPTPVAHKPGRRSTKSKPVQDEWGFFDPEQCGFAALLAKLDEVTESAEETAGRRPS